MISQNKLDELYDEILSAALHLLEKNGEFFPLGAVVQVNGEVCHIAVHDGEEQPESQTVIDQLTDIFVQQAADGQISASAIAFDGRVRSPETGDAVDAIIARVRANDYARDIVSPYSLRTRGVFKKTRSIETAEPYAKEGGQDVFI